MACPLLAWEKAKEIEGWYERMEAMMLHLLCDGPWCEVGAWKGRSTVMLAETGHPGFVVDHFIGSPEHEPGTTTLAEFEKNTKGYDLNVMVVPFEQGADSVPNGLRLLHLDGEHSYKATRRAFELYAPKVEHAGFVAFHDANGGGWPEVEAFVGEVLDGQHGRWSHFATVERLVVAKRQ